MRSQVAIEKDLSALIPSLIVGMPMAAALELLLSEIVSLRNQVGANTNELQTFRATTQKILESFPDQYLAVQLCDCLKQLVGPIAKLANRGPAHAAVWGQNE